VPDALSPVYYAAGTTEMRPRDMGGDSAFSRAVGDQRAQSVKTYLVSMGLAADRIHDRVPRWRAAHM
jgi:hypothetical protein